MIYLETHRGGILELRFESAAPAAVINALLDMGINIVSYTQSNDIEAAVTVPACYRKTVLVALDKMDVKHQIIRRKGLIWHFHAFSKRPILLVGILFFLLLTIIIPNRILFISVEGNETVSDNEILSMSEKMGLYFGSSRKNIRNERIKNYLLQEIPQLQWVGVNTKGCVATISIRERNESSDSKNIANGSGMVAIRDGIIRKMTVHSGVPLCTVGQSVRQGQTLVSGYEDCGICIRCRNVDAEVFADTIRNITAKTPSVHEDRVVKMIESQKYSVIFVKKRINLFKDTGISDASCVKMYKEFFITLPGGFVLPVSVIAYTEICYSTEMNSVQEEDTETMLSGVSDRYLLTQMISGRIGHKSYKINVTDACCVYNGTYFCYEMIGQLRNEEKYIKYEYTNRENR